MKQAADNPVTYQRATEAQALELAPRLRAADVAECVAAYGRPPLEMLPMSVRSSRHAWAASRDGRTIAMFGVGSSSLMGDVGHPWLVGSDEMSKYPKELLRRSRELVTVMGKEFSLLENYVDMRNNQSIRWLKWCGFKFDPPTPYGPYGMLFQRFSMKGGR